VRLVAGDLILRGNAEKATLHVCGTLELCEGAVFDMKKITATELRIAENAHFAISKRVDCRDLDVRGHLKARVYTDDLATVRGGGFLQGELHTRRLKVDDGGRLSVKLFLGGTPTKHKAAGKKRKGASGGRGRAAVAGR